MESSSKSSDPMRSAAGRDGPGGATGRCSGSMLGPAEEMPRSCCGSAPCPQLRRHEERSSSPDVAMRRRGHRRWTPRRCLAAGLASGVCALGAVDVEQAMSSTNILGTKVWLDQHFST